MSSNDELLEYRESLIRLPDEALVRIARANPDEYRPEAIAIAAEVLRSRGRNLDDAAFVRAALAESDYERRDRQAAAQVYTDAASTPAYPWPAWLLMGAGISIWILMARGMDGRGPNANIYIFTCGSLLLAASEYEVVRTWRRRSSLRKIRSLGFPLIATMSSIWSVLLLLGVVHY